MIMIFRSFENLLRMELAYSMLSYTGLLIWISLLVVRLNIALFCQVIVHFHIQWDGKCWIDIVKCKSSIFDMLWSNMGWSLNVVVTWPWYKMHIVCKALSSVTFDAMSRWYKDHGESPWLNTISNSYEMVFFHQINGKSNEI